MTVTRYKQENLKVFCDLGRFLTFKEISVDIPEQEQMTEDGVPFRKKVVMNGKVVVFKETYEKITDLIALKRPNDLPTLETITMTCSDPNGSDRPFLVIARKCRFNLVGPDTANPNEGGPLVFNATFTIENSLVNGVEVNTEVNDVGI